MTLAEFVSGHFKKGHGDIYSGHQGICPLGDARRQGCRGATNTFATLHITLCTVVDYETDISGINDDYGAGTVLQHATARTLLEVLSPLGSS